MADSDITTRAREVLAGLSDAEKGLVRNGACEPVPGGAFEHGTLQLRELVCRERYMVPEHEGGPATIMVWRWTDLGREVARLIAEGGAK